MAAMVVAAVDDGGRQWHMLLMGGGGQQKWRQLKKAVGDVTISNIISNAVCALCCLALSYFI
jgi:hypothetical protein